MTNRKPTVIPAAVSSTDQTLKNGTSNQQSAIEEIADLFRVPEEELGRLMQGVGHEMRIGLNTSEKCNDLKMIPSFVTGEFIPQLIIASC
jgi:hexokinase